MGLLLRFGLIIVTALCIVSGQALMSIFSRSVPTPVRPGEFLVHAVRAPAFYGFCACYALGAVTYMVLLRHHALAEVTLTLLGFMMAMTAVYTLALGQTMSGLQWLGATLTFCGILLMQPRTPALPVG